MDNSIQLISFFSSFLFGIFFSFVSRYHYNMVVSLKKVFQYLLTFLFILDVSLFYILILYYINDGVVHLYFIVVTVIGYLVEKKIFQFVKKNVKYCPFVEKLLHK